MMPDSISYSSVDSASCPLEHNERVNSPAPISYKHFDSDNVTSRHDVARNATFVSSISSSFSKEKVAMIGEEDDEVFEVIHQPPNDYDRQRIRTPEAKVSVNARNAAGQSPLSISSSKCFLEGIRLLIDMGADINLQDIYLRTPLHLACENIGSSIHHDCVHYLLVNGASVHFRDVYGRTPLHVATMAGCVECITLLLDHGATSDAKNEDGNTPLHIAAMMGHVDCMEALSHETRCDINDDDDDSHSSVDPLIFDHETVETEFNGGSFYQSPRGTTSFRVSPIPRRTIDNNNHTNSNENTPQFRNDSAYLSARGGSAWVKSKYVGDEQKVESSSTHSNSTSSSALAADDEYESDDIDSLNGSDPFVVIDEDSISLAMRMFLHVVFYFCHLLLTWSMRIYNLSKRSRNAFVKCSKSTTEGDGLHMECTPIRSNRSPGDPGTVFVQPPAHVAEAMEKLRLSRLSKQVHGLLNIS